MTNLADLQAMGGFVPLRPIEKTIKFKLDDDTEYSAVIHIKKLSIGDQERLSDRYADDVKSRRAVMISEIVTLGTDGVEVIPYEDAYKLHPSLGKAMITAISEVNGIAERKN